MREALAKGSARLEVSKTSVKVEDVTIEGAATIGVKIPKLAFDPLAGWIDERRAEWTSRFDALERHLAKETQP